MSQLNKFHVSFNIPGKTFLLGEYVALFGGPSLIATTNPSFKIEFFKTENSTTGKHPFHPESPAGRYIAAFADFFKQFEIQFDDPYQTGGFGASTAQFIAVCGFHKKYSDISNQKPFNFKNPNLASGIWRDYRSLFQEQKVPPSGADLMAQIMGGVSSFRADTGQIEKWDWPFQNMGLAFYKTPYKVNTHEHLLDLESTKLPLQQMQTCVERAMEAIKAERFDQFQEQCLQFSALQKEAGLLTRDTQKLLDQLTHQKQVLLARGCGALGADVVAVYGSSSDIPGLKKIASVPENLAYGTWMEVD